MRYRIRSSSADKVVLRLSMPERPLIIIFLILVGAVCLLSGLVYALSGTNPGDPLRALGFIGFGLFSFSALLLLSRGYDFPRQLFFMNDSGWLEAVNREGKNMGTIPYRGIGGFTVLRAAARTSEPPATVRLGVDRSDPGTLRFGWKRKSHPGSLALALVVLFSFLAALVGTRPFAAGPGAWLAAVAFGAFFLVTAVVKVVQTAGERMELTVRGGSRELRRTRLQPPDVEQFVRYRQGTFGPAEAPGMISFLRKLPAMDVSAIPWAERLALAELIRREVQGDSV